MCAYIQSRKFPSIINQSQKQKLNKVSKPLTHNQERYCQTLQNVDKNIVIAYGPAGTGKTKFAVEEGVKHLKLGDKHRFVITRPAISVDNEAHGFLPGDINNKLRPWLMPVFDFLGTIYDKSEIERMLELSMIEIAPLAFMRGRTFDDAWIIMDESQNSTPLQMLMMLTRLGKNSKLVVTGDLQQHDRCQGENGLSDLLRRLEKAKHDKIDIVEFTNSDVQRHPIIPDILEMYNEKY